MRNFVNNLKHDLIAKPNPAELTKRSVKRAEPISVETWVVPESAGTEAESSSCVLAVVDNDAVTMKPASSVKLLRPASWICSTGITSRATPPYCVPDGCRQMCKIAGGPVSTSSGCGALSQHFALLQSRGNVTAAQASSV